MPGRVERSVRPGGGGCRRVAARVHWQPGPGLCSGFAAVTELHCHLQYTLDTAQLLGLDCMFPAASRHCWPAVLYCFCTASMSPMHRTNKLANTSRHPGDSSMPGCGGRSGYRIRSRAAGAPCWHAEFSPHAHPCRCARDYHVIEPFTATQHMCAAYLPQHRCC